MTDSMDTPRAELVRRADAIGREVDRLEDLLAELGPVPGLEGLAVRLREVVDELAWMAASAELDASAVEEVSWSSGWCSEWRADDGEAGRRRQGTIEEARSWAKRQGFGVEHASRGGTLADRQYWWTR